ncbi:uncharacterized protein LOC125011816 [Mugil cephalus]|uniref:uncharacterized protein LOC125011816 n=1 Tax=Mugil cephalus TaxID=48193 RepID=UPI001FB65097|nr:uncharacterized protein LOC125011816 [Mugil cephalus]
MCLARGRVGKCDIFESSIKGQLLCVCVSSVLCEGFESPRALMSCGHAVTPMSLTKWCRRLLDEGKSRFVCGQMNCEVEWSYEEVCKMALLTPEEKKYFEKTMASNSLRNYFDTKKCPGCKSSVVRKNENNLNVCCKVCEANKGKTYEFCWQCLKEWKRPRPRSDRCDNDGCANEALKILKNCPVMVFESVKGVNDCPSIRACPTCGTLVEHSTKKLSPNVRPAKTGKISLFSVSRLRALPSSLMTTLGCHGNP